MTLLIIVATVLLFSKHASAQEIANNPVDRVDRVRDIARLFISELGELVLDVDQAFSEYTAPKVNNEDRMKERMYGRPRPDYFGRIRDNYKELQRRLGSLDALRDLSFSSRMLGLDVKNKDGASSVRMSLPFLPLQVQVKSKVPSLDSVFRLPDPTVTPPNEKVETSSGRTLEPAVGTTRSYENLNRNPLVQEEESPNSFFTT